MSCTYRVNRDDDIMLLVSVKIEPNGRNEKKTRFPHDIFR